MFITIHLMSEAHIQQLTHYISPCNKNQRKKLITKRKENYYSKYGEKGNLTAVKKAAEI